MRDGHPSAADALDAIAEVVTQFDLRNLQPHLAACRELASSDAPLDVAVLGQFKSGKSSLLNAILNDDVFPVGVLPATAVVTRAVGGDQWQAIVKFLDGSTVSISREQVADFVTESGNPKNVRRVAGVDVETPALRDWPELRFVDTPGLGSAFEHNTQTTRDWLPHVAVALVVVSAERPLSAEDNALISEAIKLAGRVFVVLSKIDLLSTTEAREVQQFLDRRLADRVGDPIPVQPFSARTDSGQWVQRLKTNLLAQLIENAANECNRALCNKILVLVAAAQSYLEIALKSADATDANRQALREAVRSEIAQLSILTDELRQTERSVTESVRSIVEKSLKDHHDDIAARLIVKLKGDARTWTGNLAIQSERFRSWLNEHLLAELRTVSRTVEPLAAGIVDQARQRLLRVVEACRDRLGQEIQAKLGIAMATIRWEPRQPQLNIVPIAIDRTFMMNWELLAWVLPMSLIGRIFRRHLQRRLPWETYRNLTRLGNDWIAAIVAALAILRDDANAHARSELETLERLLGRQDTSATTIQRFRERLNTIRDSISSN